MGFPSGAPRGSLGGRHEAIAGYPAYRVNHPGVGDVASHQLLLDHVQTLGPPFRAGLPGAALRCPGGRGDIDRRGVAGGPQESE